jgi:prevent-host-death family protein
MTRKGVMMTNREVGVAEAKKHLSELLGRVAYGGERIVISKRGKPMAVLIPPTESAEEGHLSKVEGWLDSDDPFFEAMGQIVSERAAHIPRVSQSSRD